MIQVELKNKLSLTDFPNDVNLQDLYTTIDISRMEDVLTSNIFGTIKNLDISILNTILKEAKINYQFQYPPIFDFWKKLSNKTEPDILITNKEVCIVVEVKFHSDFDKGSDKKKPQIVREIEGAKKNYKSKKIYFLAITKNDRIFWKEKVHQKYDQEIEKYKNLLYLHHISWEKIYKILKLISNSENLVDIVTKYFIKDLVEYLEAKEIGFTTKEMTTKRDLSYFFGKNIFDLEQFIKNISKIHKNQYEIDLMNLPFEEKKELYKKIINFINKMKTDNLLQSTKNNIQTNSVTSDLLLISDVEEFPEWIKLISKLFLDEYVNLNGISDVSVLLKMNKGNYTHKPVSLLTYYKKNRKLVFSKER